MAGRHWPTCEMETSDRHIPTPINLHTSQDRLLLVKAGIDQEH